MKERPILFSGPMVSALLAGMKTQTRRMLKAEPPPGAQRVIRPFQDDRLQWAATDPHDMEQGQLLLGEAPRCPYGAPGDRLWVRERHSIGPRPNVALQPGETTGALRCPHVTFAADGAVERREERWKGAFGVSRPSIHMPRWASRITLEVTSVRLERLQDISDADAVAEGIGIKEHAIGVPTTIPPGMTLPRAMYQAVWEEINGAGSWNVNPWVWCVEFRRV